MIYHYKAAGGVIVLADDAMTVLHGDRDAGAIGFWLHYPEKLGESSQTGDILVVEQRNLATAPDPEDVLDGSAPHHWRMAPGDVLELDCRSETTVYAIAITGTPTVYAGDKV